MRNFGIGLHHFFSISGLAYDICLYTCRKEGRFEYIRDPTIIQFLEESLVGGINFVTCHISRSCTERLGDCDLKPHQRHEIFSVDTNSSYGFALMQELPIGNYRFLTEDQVNAFNINSFDEKDGEGLLILCSVEYPESKHEEHSSLPLGVHKGFVSVDDLSPHQRELIQKFKASIGESLDTAKILLTLKNNENLFVYHKTLQFYVRHGLVVKRYKKILRFDQKPWMKPCIKKCALLRNTAPNELLRGLIKQVSIHVAHIY